MKAQVAGELCRAGAGSRLTDAPQEEQLSPARDGHSHQPQVALAEG